MRELQTDDQVVVAAVRGPMFGPAVAQQPIKRRLCRLVQDELARVGPALFDDSRRLAPDQFGPTCAEAAVADGKVNSSGQPADVASQPPLAECTGGCQPSGNRFRFGPEERRQVGAEAQIEGRGARPRPQCRPSAWNLKKRATEMGLQALREIIVALPYAGKKAATVPATRSVTAARVVSVVPNWWGRCAALPRGGRHG